MGPDKTGIRDVMKMKYDDAWAWINETWMNEALWLRVTHASAR